jgi:hypothetical protein
VDVIRLRRRGPALAAAVRWIHRLSPAARQGVAEQLAIRAGLTPAEVAAMLARLSAVYPVHPTR